MRKAFPFRKILSLNNITANPATTATKLTIRWNSTAGVNSLSSAGQLIPFIVGLSIVLRVLYFYWKDEEPPREEGEVVVTEVEVAGDMLIGLGRVEVD